MDSVTNWSIQEGDAIALMATLADASVDAAVFDPPFTSAGGSTNGRTSSADGQFFAHWLRAVFVELRRVVKPEGCAFIFCDWRTIGVLQASMTPLGERQRGAVWDLTQAIVWDRECFGLGSPFRNSFEMIGFARGPSWQSDLPKNIPNLIRCRWPYGRHEFHQAEKPVQLVRQLVEWACPVGGTVLDPFAGSGTTIVAAVESGRNAIGFEIEPDVAAVAVQRATAASKRGPAAATFRLAPVQTGLDL